MMYDKLHLRQEALSQIIKANTHTHTHPHTHTNTHTYVYIYIDR